MTTSPNPYTITFGKEPRSLIPRTLQASTVLDEFRQDEPSNQVYVVVGPRGSGKTVFMTNVAGRLAHENDWVTVELNPERDLLEGLVSKLNSERRLAGYFRDAKINLSFLGFGVQIEGAQPIVDIETAVTKMLQSLQRHGKRLLITVDEVTSTPAMKEFASAFQIFLRQNLPIYLLMTGLYENVNDLQNEKSLTFLYRAPKIELKPLNLGTIARNYQRTLDVSSDLSLEMARLTRGYSFAFQVLGYLMWGQKELTEHVMDSYRQYLDDYVYDKIWSELSAGDRRLAVGIAKSQTGKVSDVRDILDMETNQFNPYRRRLIRKGVINGEERGYVRFALPCFEDYALEHEE